MSRIGDDERARLTRLAPQARLVFHDGVIGCRVRRGALGRHRARARLARRGVRHPARRGHAPRHARGGQRHPDLPRDRRRRRPVLRRRATPSRSSPPCGRSSATASGSAGPRHPSAVAARFNWASSAEQLLELMRRTVGPGSVAGERLVAPASIRPFGDAERGRHRRERLARAGVDLHGGAAVALRDAAVHDDDRACDAGAPARAGARPSSRPGTSRRRAGCRRPSRAMPRPGRRRSARTRRRTPRRASGCRRRRCTRGSPSTPRRRRRRRRRVGRGWPSRGRSHGFSSASAVGDGLRARSAARR